MIAAILGGRFSYFMSSSVPTSEASTSLLCPIRRTRPMQRMLQKMHSSERFESSLHFVPNPNSARGLSASRLNEARTRLRR